MMILIKSLLLASGVAHVAQAQFPPASKGITVIKSKFHDGVAISYKEPGICETTPGVKSYAGYVHLPPGYLGSDGGGNQDYPINTFFWFFEARKDPTNAPLAIWLNGGPGASSMMGLLQENGPCFVNGDSETTSLNPWSWNNEVNMLYIDEPNQVGFSFDLPTNCTVDITGESGPKPADFSNGVPRTNNTFKVGTFSTQNSSHTADNTLHAGHALWHFAQSFFSEFPHYKPANDRISLWAESYGGHYGPGFFELFQQQNEKIEGGELSGEHAHYLHLDTLGIINGWIDGVLQEEAYITFPFNNTYGLQIFNQSIYDELMHNFTRPGGCKEQLTACQKQLKGNGAGKRAHASVSIDKICNIEQSCQSPALNLFAQQDGAGYYDIAHPQQDPFPAPHMHGYLTQESVLGAIGTPVNFTKYSSAVAAAFSRTDDEYDSFTDALGYLLDSGIKVHMMFGDRDHACNWVGGEAASLAIPYSGHSSFENAGYAELRSGGSVTGMTRQYGNYSFSRVFQSGHMVPAYQPEAAYDIFMRATFNRDIATGEIAVTDDLATKGPVSTWHIKNKPPVKPVPRCYALEPASCVASVWRTVVEGTATIKNWWVVEEHEEDRQLEL